MYLPSGAATTFDDEADRKECERDEEPEPRHLLSIKSLAVPFQTVAVTALTLSVFLRFQLHAGWFAFLANAPPHACPVYRAC